MYGNAPPEGDQDAFVIHLQTQINHNIQTTYSVVNNDDLVTMAVVELK